jgi:putative heme-binding domain-containing protein
VKVFTASCAACHHLGGIGQEIGPNLRSVSGWSPDMLLTNILDPNRQVEPRYLSYTATLTNGESVFGIITAETGNGIVIKGIDGKERELLRGSIQSLAGSGRSLMPDGLEANLSPQDVADLLRFLQSPPSEP